MTDKLPKRFIDFIRTKCYCGFLSKSKEIHKGIGGIPELCIYCKTLNNYYLYLDQETKLRKGRQK